MCRVLISSRHLHIEHILSCAERIFPQDVYVERIFSHMQSAYFLKTFVQSAYFLMCEAPSCLESSCRAHIYAERLLFEAEHTFLCTECPIPEAKHSVFGQALHGFHLVNIHDYFTCSILLLKGCTIVLRSNNTCGSIKCF